VRCAGGRCVSEICMHSGDRSGSSVPNAKGEDGKEHRKAKSAMAEASQVDTSGKAPAIRGHELTSCGARLEVRRRAGSGATWHSRMRRKSPSGVL